MVWDVDCGSRCTGCGAGGLALAADIPAEVAAGESEPLVPPGAAWGLLAQGYCFGGNCRLTAGCIGYT